MKNDESTIPEKRSQLMQLNRDIVQLLGFLHDADEKINKMKKSATALYLSNTEELDSEET